MVDDPKRPVVEWLVVISIIGGTVAGIHGLVAACAFSDHPTASSIAILASAVAFGLLSGAMLRR